MSRQTNYTIEAAPGNSRSPQSGSPLKRERSSPAGVGAVLACLLLVVAGCDLTVTNPGPVNDESLGQANAHEGLVNGTGRGLSDALNWVALTSGAISQEVVGSGNLIAFGVNLNVRAGRLLPEETADWWDRAQRARWIAESGIERMRSSEEVEFESYPLAARALLYAGYANRLLGENFCEAVFDGGPREPREEYFNRSLANFTEAIAVAEAAGEDEILLAATAGRASVRIWLDDWAGAVDDAETVPSSFSYEARMTIANVDEYNRIYWAIANQPFRTISVVNTFYEDYYADTGDPRTPWDKLEGFPFGDAGDPPVPFLRQRKYTERSDGINLSSGWEMRLIEAEAMLRNSQWENAIELLNVRRNALGLDAIVAADAEEAWTRFKRERGIELWLEGRRLGDFWRWQQTDAPGDNPDYTGQDLCFPIAQSELDTNPNL